MTNEWHELTDLTGDRDFLVTGVKLAGSGVEIRGEFELPPLARLRYEDQVFVAEFIRSHGSIKDMGASFGISYPTVKSRLNRIASLLQLVEVAVGTPAAASAPSAPPTEVDDILGMLERGEISASDAAREISQP